jgi:hypothetical protein
MFSDDEDAIPEEGEEHHEYRAPILAEDEVIKRPTSSFEPAVELGPVRRGSAFEMEEPRSRPTSRPASIYREPVYDVHSTMLEDVQEYDPLFPEDEKQQKAQQAAEKKDRSYTPRFPSRDVWEDQPPSLDYSAEVSTPEPAENPSTVPEVPPRESSTPAHAFAKQQEQLAEKELKLDQPENFLHQKQRKSVAQQQLQQQPPQNHFLSLATSEAHRETPAPRFPSRDVWEDTPDSAQLQAEISTPQEEAAKSPENTKPLIPQRPQKKLSDPATAPSVPERPKRKSSANEDGVSPTAKSPPSMPSKPKPEIPARPFKPDSSNGGQESKDASISSKPKPAVPVRPVGSKIAALQAGFMSDLNNRLKLGPQAPKKEEPAPEAETLTEEEKAPLADARKGRARGPQRRAPKASPSAAAGPAAEAVRERPILSFSSTCTVFSMDPDSDHVTISSVALTAVEGTAKDAEESSSKQKSEVTTDKGEAGEDKKEEEKEEKKEEKKETKETSSNPPLTGQDSSSGSTKAPSQAQSANKTSLDKGEAAQVAAAQEVAGGLSGPTAEQGKAAIDMPEAGPQSEHTERAQGSEPAPEKQQEVKSLATNTAGETLLETHLTEDKEENVKSAEAEEGQKN